MESVCAVAWNPSGSRVIESPWLIQTGCSRSMPANSPSSAVIVTVAGPYSRFGREDIAAELEGHQLGPVADAEDRQRPLQMAGSGFGASSS